MNKSSILFCCMLVFTLAALAQVPAPAGAQLEPIAIVKGTIHIGNGQLIENGSILFRDGQIESVGPYDSSAELGDYKVVDASGKHVYPGLILVSSQLGLIEVSAVRATKDAAETGDVKPHVRSAIAFNTDSEVLPTMKFNGIQIAQIAPTSGRVAGTSSIMQLDAWNWEDALYEEDDAVHMSWPSLTTPPKWWLGEKGRKENKDYKEQVDEVKKLLDDTRSYVQIQPLEKNLKLEAMKGVLTGEKQLFVQVYRPQEIIEAIQTLKSYDLPKVVLVGCTGIWPVVDLVKESGYPVVIENVHRKPSRDDEAVDWPFRLPGELTKKGILVGLTHTPRMLASSRNLAFTAGTVAAYGMEKEQALSLITLNNARILGIEERTGTLQQGKDANVIISEGDLLDMRSSVITHSFIQGRQVNLEALQQRLYEKYKEKYEAQK